MNSFAIALRFASATSIGSLDVIYGISANNNPTVQDVWNTTPAWSFPYAASTIAPTPSAKTKIESVFAAHVGGVGAYTFINDLLYLEASGYRTLSFSQQNALGTDPFGAPGLLGGVAPYWRAAIEPHWGRHSLMLGTFGMLFDVNPCIDTSFATFSTNVFPMSDKFTDIGFDTQYQYQGDNYWLTLRGSYIREFQRLDASFANLASANLTNQLNSLKLQVSVALGADNRVALTGQYFDIRGTPDAKLYGIDANTGLALTPNSNGWQAEIAHVPFMASKSGAPSPAFLEVPRGSLGQEGAPRQLESCAGAFEAVGHAVYSRRLKNSRDRPRCISRATAFAKVGGDLRNDGRRPASSGTVDTRVIVNAAELTTPSFLNVLRDMGKAISSRGDMLKDRVQFFNEDARCQPTPTPFCRLIASLPDGFSAQVMRKTRCAERRSPPLGDCA